MTPVLYAKGISRWQSSELESCHFFNGLAKTKAKRSKQDILPYYFYIYFFSEGIFSHTAYCKTASVIHGRVAVIPLFCTSCSQAPTEGNTLIAASE